MNIHNIKVYLGDTVPGPQFVNKILFCFPLDLV